MRWDYVTNFSGVLAENVEAYSASANGQRIALLRSQGITANGVEVFDLDVFDLQTKQIYTRLHDIPRLFQLSTSPNAQWLAYQEKMEGGAMYLLHLTSEAAPQPAGQCDAKVAAHCSQFSWSLDSQVILWGDERGIWKYVLSDPAPAVIHNGEVEVTDPRGSSSLIRVGFSDFAWSPAGRFVLVGMLPLDSQVRWTALLDTMTGRLVEIPDTYSASGSPASVIWALDGSIISANGGSFREEIPPVLKFWRIYPTRNDLIYPGRVYTLESEHFPLIGDIEEAGFALEWLNQTSPDWLSFGVSLPDHSSPAVLLQLSLKDGRLRKIQELPNDTSQVLWAPDGGGSLILGGQFPYLFAPASGGTLIDLREILGAAAHDFHWLPPTPRN